MQGKNRTPSVEGSIDEAILMLSFIDGVEATSIKMRRRQTDMAASGGIDIMQNRDTTIEAENPQRRDTSEQTPSRGIAHQDSIRADKLTLREKQIATQMAVGKNKRQISRRLMLPVSIVERHSAAIHEKLHISGTTELVLYEINNGYTSLLRNDFMKSQNQILDYLPVLASVIDMESHDILYANRHMQKVFGDVVGKKCWEVLHTDQNGPCAFCRFEALVDEDGLPTEPCRWQLKNTITQRCYDMIDTAALTEDRRLVKIGIGIDITDQLQKQQATAHPHTDTPPPDDWGHAIVVCSNCNKLRDDAGEWFSPASYFQKHLGTYISHGICERCATRLYPWMFDDSEED
ncbi:hypothetical protein DESC_720076 [Desulfosarcina cetonica]|nr:hypothetical protein DESC_720076 [Desulfosarcina cetonica]